MSLRSFLDCAYALLVAEYQRLGMNLMDAIDENAQWQAGGVGSPVEQESRQRDHESMGRQQARQNDQAMQQLQALMGGTSFGV
jgi:hypothetical protein